jgi:Tol biopolymer transport system component
MFLGACAADIPGPVALRLDGSMAASVDGGWSVPENLGATINGPANDQQGIVSKDGLSLYFVSDRPGGAGGLDLYVAQRETVDSPWGAPANMTSINTAGADFAPNLSIDGHLLFFASNRPGGHGLNDIWLARRANPNDDFGWGAPVNVGDGVNTTDADQAPLYLQNAEDGAQNLYFNRGVNTLNQADIYRAAITRNGEVRGVPEKVDVLNVAGANDAAPTLSHDGKEIFFWSSRSTTGAMGGQDIWTSTRKNVHEEWSTPVNVGTPINTSSNDLTPSLSFDGASLLIASNRPGGKGGTDLYVSTRAKAGHE